MCIGYNQANRGISYTGPPPLTVNCARRWIAAMKMMTRALKNLTRRRKFGRTTATRTRSSRERHNCIGDFLK